LLCIYLIQYVVFWINNIPKDGQMQSPKEMIMGEQILDTKFICKLPFGVCVQAHDDLEITNTMLPRTTGAINLGPSNMRGGHQFLSLVTGEIIMQRNWTEMSVPTDVIIRLEQMSKDLNDSLEDFLENVDDVTPTEQKIEEEKKSEGKIDLEINEEKETVLEEDNFHRDAEEILGVEDTRYENKVMKSRSDSFERNETYIEDELPQSGDK
jgi:hypothetical protein